MVGDDSVDLLFRVDCGMRWVSFTLLAFTSISNKEHRVLDLYSPDATNPSMTSWTRSPAFFTLASNDPNPPLATGIWISPPLASPRCCRFLRTNSFAHIPINFVLRLPPRSVRFICSTSSRDRTSIIYGESAAWWSTRYPQEAKSRAIKGTVVRKGRVCCVVWMR